MSFSVSSTKTNLVDNHLALVKATDSEEEAYVLAEELVYDGEDFTEQALSGYTAEGEANGTAIEICPGTGVPCRVIVVIGSETTVYSAKKQKGGPDIKIFAE